MKKLIILAVLLLAGVAAQTAQAQEPVRNGAAPFGAQQGAEGVFVESKPAGEIGAAALAPINNGANWLLTQQAVSGGFPWSVGDPVLYGNVQGPSGLAMLEASKVVTGSTTFLYSGLLNSAFIIPHPVSFANGYPRFSTHDPLMLVTATKITSDSLYSTYLKQMYWDRLRNGVYGTAADQTAQEYCDSVVTARAGSGFVTLSAWDLSALVIAAHLAGEPATRDACFGSILSALQQTVGGETYDTIGLAGALWAATATGKQLNPTSGFWASFDNNAELAAELSLYRVDSSCGDRGWRWSTSADPSDCANADVQTTAFSILALAGVDKEGYEADLIEGRDFILGLQQGSGQILPFPGAVVTEAGGVETHAEALRALALLYSLGIGEPFVPPPPPAVYLPVILK